jgi:trehalose 6-phosphate synthase
MRFDKSDSIFWVHDYHFLPLGAEMRRLGIERPIGFFLHTPWPDRPNIVSPTGRQSAISTRKFHS